MPLAGCRLHRHGDGLGAVQAVRGAVDGTAEAVRGPKAAPRVPALLVGILGGFRTALGRHGDEGLGGAARRHGRCGLLVTGRI